MAHGGSLGVRGEVEGIMGGLLFLFLDENLQLPTFYQQCYGHLEFHALHLQRAEFIPPQLKAGSLQVDTAVGALNDTKTIT